MSLPALLSGCRAVGGGGRSQQAPQAHWTEDTHLAGHRLRDGKPPFPPPPKPDEHMEVVVIGAGISGLTVAHQLRHVDKLLVLESASQPGGNAKSGDYQGIQYALGSAYFVDIEEPFASLYSEISVPLTPLRQPEDWVAEAPGQLKPLESSRFAHDLERLQRHITAIGKHANFPRFPVQAATSNALALDRISLRDYLGQDYGPELLEWVDAYCRSSLGCGVQQASAYAGLNFLSELAVPVYALPGGNAGIIERLLPSVGSARIRLQAFTYRVRQVGDRVHTTYWHEGHARTVSSHAVVLAVPYGVASRLLAHSPVGLTTMPYGAYMVANLCFNRPVHTSGYDTWMPKAQTFTDVVDATVCLSKAPTHAQVLTVYAPMRDPQAGRHVLLSASAGQVAQPLWQAVSQWLPAIPADALEQVVMSRYGHSLLSSRAGIIHQVRGLPLQVGQVYMAHSDGQGAASVESAVLQGLAAAKAVKRSLARVLI